jgi:hypothetical protein
VTTTNSMILIAAALLAGCGADAKPTARAHVSLDASALASHSLSASSLARMQLVSTPDGRAMLSHVVACALPRGTSITAITRDGTPYSFAGRLGLAPAMAQHAPSQLEQDRLRACVVVQSVGLIQA